MQILPIGVDRIDLILEIYQDCEDFLALGPVAEASKEMVLADIAHAGAIGSIYCGLFTDQGRLIGIVDYLPRHYLNEPGFAFIELIMIAENFRGQGLGTTAVQVLEGLIWAEPDVHKIGLAVQVNNHRARWFWEKLGYRIISEPEDQPDGTTVYPMQKTRRDMK